MAKKTVDIFPGKNFGIVYDRDEEPNTIEFALHNHDDIYEIVLLLGGDCEFCVEGNTYKVNPGDIVFTRPFELHHIVSNLWTTCSSLFSLGAPVMPMG